MRGSYARHNPGASIPDHALIDACGTSAIRAAEVTGGRLYVARYTVGEGPMTSTITRTFAVGHAEAARVYAREYGIRILGTVGPTAGLPVRLEDVRWQR